MRLTHQQFIARFHPDEMAAILTAAKVSVAVEVWLFRFNNLTPDSDGTAIDVDDPLIALSLQQFEAGGLLGVGRAQEIIGSAHSFGGFVKGQSVRILPPFNASLPDIYTIKGFDVESGSVLIADGGSFSPSYLEAV